MIRTALHATAAAAATAATLPAAPACAEAARPNLVVIVADDVQPQLVGFDAEGRRHGFTPHLEELAAAGTVLAELHSPSPVCTPSRYCFLTGTYASRATNPGFLRDTRKNGGQTAVAFNTHLDPSGDNIPKRLRNAGYTTGVVGKNHVVDVPGHQRLPYRSDASDPKVLKTLEENQQKLAQAWAAAGFDYAEGLYFGNPDADGIRELAQHNQDWVTEAANRFIADAAEKEQPFFLYMATTIPHGPHEKDRSWNADPRVTPTGYLQEGQIPGVQPARETIPERLKEAGVNRWNAENVLWLDDAVGAVVKQLEDAGVKEDTVLVFFSDHGTEAKGSVYRRGTRTVGLIWRDGGFGIGDVLEQPVSLVDLGPTLLGWAGVDPEGSDYDGESLLPALAGEEPALHDHQYFELGFTRAVVKDGMKYVAVRYPDWAEEMPRQERQERLDDLVEQLESRGRPVPTTDPMTPYSHLTVVPGGADAEQVAIGKHPAYFASDQLYDLDADPDEQDNLADDPAHAGTLEELQQLLHKEVSDLPGHFAEFGTDEFEPTEQAAAQAPRTVGSAG